MGSIATHSPGTELIELLPSDIVCDHDWNSRQEYADRPEAETPSDQLSTAQLEESIREHGILQPPRVRQLPDGRYTAVFGFRRILAASRVSPDAPIKCLLSPSTGDEEVDDRNARFANLIENVHREALRPWEIADSLYNIKQAHPSLTQQEIAARSSFSTTYVNCLLQIRTKAHEEIWLQYKRWGVSLSISYKTLLAIVRLPKERQLEAWNEALEALKTKNPRRGKQKRPGLVRLAKYLDQADVVDKPAAFRRGLKLGLELALGKTKWRDVPKK